MIDKLKNFYHNGMSPEELAERSFQIILDMKHHLFQSILLN